MEETDLSPLPQPNRPGHRSDQLRAVIGIEAAEPGAPFQLEHQSAMSPASREHTYAGDIYHLCTGSPSSKCTYTHTVDSEGLESHRQTAQLARDGFAVPSPMRRSEHTLPRTYSEKDTQTRICTLPMWCRICWSAGERDRLGTKMMGFQPFFVFASRFVRSKQDRNGHIVRE